MYTNGSRDNMEVNPNKFMSLRKQKGIMITIVMYAVRAAKFAPGVACVGSSHTSPNNVVPVDHDVQNLDFRI
jgi:hypothetical protein